MVRICRHGSKDSEAQLLMRYYLVTRSYLIYDFSQSDLLRLTGNEKKAFHTTSFLIVNRVRKCSMKHFLHIFYDPLLVWRQAAHYTQGGGTCDGRREKTPQIIKEIGKLNKEDSLGFWIAIGMMLGVAFGSAIESIDISVGIAVGMLAGIVLDCVFGSPDSSGTD